MISAAGSSTAAGNLGWRFFGTYGTLVGRLQQLSPNEEAKITGRAYGAVTFNGLLPTIGNTVSVTLTGGGLTEPLTVTVVVQNSAPNGAAWTNNTVASALAQAFALQPAFVSAGFYAIANYGSAPYTQMVVPLPTCSILAAYNAPAFTISVSTTGLLAAQIGANGMYLSPFMTFSRVGQVQTVYGYLPILNILESGFLASSANMSAMVAGDVTLRWDEAEQRNDQYDMYRKRLGDWLGIPLNSSQRPGPTWSPSLVGY
jgi:hypothetical protein